MSGVHYFALETSHCFYGLDLVPHANFNPPSNKPSVYHWEAHPTHFLQDASGSGQAGALGLGARVGRAQMINLLLSSSPAAFGLGGRAGQGRSERGFLHPLAPSAGQSIPRCSINKRINEEKSLVVPPHNSGSAPMNRCMFSYLLQNGKIVHISRNFISTFPVCIVEQPCVDAVTLAAEWRDKKRCGGVCALQVVN